MPEAARESVTAKSIVAPAPSRALASATLSAIGPETVTVAASDSVRPSAVRAAPAGSVKVTAPWPSGVTPTCHRSRRPFTRRAFATVPPATRIAASFAFVSTASLNRMRTANALPSWAAGAFETRAVSGSAAGGSAASGGACCCSAPEDGVSFVTDCPENAATSPPSVLRSLPDPGGV